MKRFAFIMMAVGVLTLPFNLDAAQVKLKFVGSIYTDAAGGALQDPTGVSIADGRLLVADSGGKRVLSYLIREGEARPDQIFPLPGMFPLMVQPAPNGEFYVLDGRERQIVILESAGKVKGKFVPKGLPGSQRLVPRSIKLAPDGSLLVLDVFSERVLKFDGSGNFQKQLAFPEQFGAFADVTMDRSGNVYLLDSVEAVVYVARSGSDTFQALTTGMKSNMNFPTSLATDNVGTLFLVDKHGSGLAILGVDGSFAGRRLSMGWNDGQLYYPSQVSISEAGNLFIADTKNNRVQHFSIAD